ncbi:MAG TPA: hypothetical protein PK293_05190 [Spirochaetota bacterium]|nr:hypothetical protein [Spirochaetota bacterium]
MKYFALIDPSLAPEAVKKLKLLDIEPLAVPRTDLVDKPLSGHPDIQVFLHRGIAFFHPDIDKNFLKRLSSYCDIRIGTTRLSDKYPGDIAYNIAATEEYAFHKKNAADEIIKDYFEDNNIPIIEVKQGYTKCSTLIIDERRIITADSSIHNAALQAGFNSLLIKPGYIALPGYQYGFIGGASGKFKNRIIFTGRIDHHPDREKIYSFIETAGCSIEILSDDPALDTGSLLISSY